MANIRDWTALSRPYMGRAAHHALNADIATRVRLPAGGLNAEAAEAYEFEPIDPYDLNVEYERPGVTKHFQAVLNDQRLSQLFDRKHGFVSFSGADIQAAIWFPIFGEAGVYSVNSLQTITVSTFRDMIPGRKLGTASAVGYARGTRTVAGSLVMVLAEQDAFSSFLPTIESFRKHADQGENPFYLDRIPPFWLVLTAMSEVADDLDTEDQFLHSGSMVIRGINLVSTSNTLSVNDIYTETMYQYVAEDILPFASRDMTSVLKQIRERVSLQRQQELNSTRERFLKFTNQQVEIQENLKFNIESASQPGAFESPAFDTGIA